MKKLFVIALAAASCALATGAANARTNVSWAIGINAAPIGVAVSNGPIYAPAPVYYEPAPVYYQPAPVYYEPAPVYVEPAPVYVQPRAVYRPARYYGVAPVVYGGYGRYWDSRARVWRDRDRDGRRDEYGDHHRGGWQPVPRDERRYHHQ
jgi:hypothetical protein